jgi:nitrate reductase cytochrome c-type subunit
MKPTAVILAVLALVLVACGERVYRAPSRPTVVARDVVTRPAGVPDTEISLFKGSVFEDPTPPPVAWVDTMPGSNEPLPALFEGAPPRIPHGIRDFLPITVEENGCIECHRSDDPDEEAPQLPDSHKTDLRNAPDEVGETTTGARFLCVLCHVPVSDAKPLPDGVPPTR